MTDQPISSNNNNIFFYQELSPDTLIRKRYLVQCVLGQGGFGRTYLAFDQQRFNKPCVLKEFFPSSKQKHIVAKSKELFEREARVLNSLEHRQIPKFFGWFKEDNRLFLVQDYVDGQTYGALLQQGKKFAEKEIVKFFQDLLPVLDYIHRNNIIHRDISPDNIMLPDNGEKPILIDFGVVNYQYSDRINQDQSTFVEVTTVGKFGYSPREQIVRGKCYPNTDLYALAVTAIVLLTGMQPQLLMQENDERWIWEPYIDVSNELKTIINKMLAHNPEKRYQSAQEVLSAINSRQIIIDEHQNISNTFIPAYNDNSNIRDLLTDKEVSATSSRLSEKRKVSNFQKFTPIFYLCLTIAILGAMFLGIKSPEIDSLCELIDNCHQEPLW